MGYIKHSTIPCPMNIGNEGRAEKVLVYSHSFPENFHEQRNVAQLIKVACHIRSKVLVQWEGRG